MVAASIMPSRGDANIEPEVVDEQREAIQA
jgi:hypothetical protein